MICSYSSFASNSSMGRSNSSASSSSYLSAASCLSPMQRASTNTLKAERRPTQPSPLATGLVAPAPLRMHKLNAHTLPIDGMPFQPRLAHPLRDVAAQSATIIPKLPIAPIPEDAWSFAPASAERTKDRGLQQIVGGLYLAYEDELAPFDINAPEDLRTHSGQPFTHVLNLSDRAQANMWPVRTVDAAGASRLAIQLPERSWAQRAPRSKQVKHSEEELLRMQSKLDVPIERLRAMFNADTSGEGMPSLTRQQLIAARDFLATSGYDLTSDKDFEEIKLSKTLLITCPRGRETDAVTVLACYASFVTQYMVSEILRIHDQSDEVAAAWKGVVSQRAERWIDDIAQW